jgi:hypothetical protein
VQQEAEAVRVAVYSPSEHLAPQLREALPDLLKQLEQKGFDPRAIVTPSTAPTPEVRTETANDSNTGFQQQSRDAFQHRQERRRDRKDAWADLVMQLHYK